MNALSTRAQRVLRHATHTIDELNVASLRWSREVGPVEALERCREIAAKRQWSVHTLLMNTRGCGLLTRHELFAWMGTPEESKPHVHICRDCGQKMGTCS